MSKHVGSAALRGATEAGVEGGGADLHHTDPPTDPQVYLEDRRVFLDLGPVRARHALVLLGLAGALHEGRWPRLGYLADVWLSSEERDALAETLAVEGAGMPAPAWPGFEAEAESWAAMATRRELRAHLKAVWRRLPPPDRATFLRRARP